jgi:hypothetical protein
MLKDCSKDWTLCSLISLQRWTVVRQPSVSCPDMCNTSWGAQARTPTSFDTYSTFTQASLSPRFQVTLPIMKCSGSSNMRKIHLPPERKGAKLKIRNNPQAQWLRAAFSWENQKMILHVLSPSHVHATCHAVNGNERKTSLKKDVCNAKLRNAD